MGAELTKWTRASLGDVCEINPPKPQIKDYDDDTPVAFVPMAAVDDRAGRVMAAQHLTLGDVRTKSYRTFTSEDVIFAKITPCMENGKSAVVPAIDNGLGFGSTEFHVLRPKSGVSPRFIWHFVRQENFRRNAREHMTGSVGQARVPADFLRNFVIEVPSEDLQEKIVTLLDTATESAHRAADRLIRARLVIERFRKTILAAACSGRLSADWREEHPNPVTVEHALAEFGQSRRRKARLRDQPVDLRLPELPETYIASTVGNCAQLLEYGTSKRCDPTPIGVPVLRMGNIQDGKLSNADLKYCEIDREIERLLLSDGDLLFNRTNSPELVGKAAVFHGKDQMSFASYLVRVRFAEGIAAPDFVSYWVNSTWGREWARLAKTDGVSQSNISAGKLALMPLPLPPIDEQQVIVARASRMLATADMVMARISAISESVSRTTQAVLAKAFRGDLVGQDDMSVS